MNNVTYKPGKAGVHVVVFRTVMKKEKSNNPKKIHQGKYKVIKTVIAEETFDEWEAAYAWGDQFLV
ncbi:hypothetical protein BGI36_07225 [Snodgrassella communis]|uniref:hypothetical protein n=1 Tax=Snodgrassella communis TaxID=2946699 RepID=UPI000C1F3D3E|nr:hypothetical protein [Snodgrassella communis]PIT20881.1 hypothetical protein BGI36_07225 [Snodgrassella communis]